MPFFMTGFSNRTSHPVDSLKRFEMKAQHILKSLTEEKRNILKNLSFVSHEKQNNWRKNIGVVE